MKNIHILPTDNPSRLYFDVVTKKLLLQERLSLNATCFPIEKRNIYITSDEESKFRDWYIKDGEVRLWQNAMPEYHKLNGEKIILTTDQDLISDGVQSIPDSILEWFVKNPSCELVNIRKVANGVKNHKLTYEYKIIIPKEEPKQESVINEKCFKCGNSQYKMGRPFCTDDFCNKDFYEKPKQETLEEAAELYKKLHEFRVKKEQIQRKEGFIDGAKWQQERSYSEEEVLEILNHHTSYLETFIYQYIDRQDMEVNEKWLKQFKKK